MAAGFTDILYETRDGTATITLNRPDKLNAFRSRTLQELIGAVRAADRNGSVGVIVVTGAGDKAFCAGGDIEEMASLDRKTGRAFTAHLLKVAETLWLSPKPTIARVDGYCLGGGNEIQLFCDLTYASGRSVFGQVGPKIGSAPLWGGTQLLPAVIGLKKAKEMMLLCEHVPAAEAARLGLVNHVVPATLLDASVRAAAASLLNKSPRALAAVKRCTGRALLKTLADDLRVLEKLFGSKEYRESMTAFLEGRSAHPRDIPDRE